MQPMAAPPRRTAPSIARLNQASVEYWKAENQKLRDRNASLHRRLHKYKNFVCTLQEDARKFTFIHKGHRYEFPRLLILARSHVLADAMGTGQHPAENIPPPGDADNPMYSYDTTDLFPDFDPTTFHIFLQMLSRFCIYKPDSIQIDRIKQIWRIRDFFDIPTLLLNEEDLVNKIRDVNMTTFQGIRKELDFALRYNWRGLKCACLDVLRHKTGDLGGLSSSMRDTEIMGLLDTLVIAERRKSGLVDKEEDNMSGDGLEGIRWSTASENDKEELDGRDAMDDDDEDEDDDEDDDHDDEGEESNEVADETTMDLVLLE